MPSPDIERLVALAESAPPMARPPRQGFRWAALWPVVERLRGRGFTYDEAISWLVEQGAMEEKDRERARTAFWQIAFRRRRRAERCGK